MKSGILTMVLAATVMGTLALPLVVNADAPHQGNINQRLANQHSRIENGMKSGQLTRHESYRVRGNNAGIRAQELRDRHRSGHLTRAEHGKLERDLNRNSRTIYRLKHNDRTN